jgi:hypothetical protein
MPDLLRPLVLFFAALAAIGLALSVLSHIEALLGLQGPLGDYEWLLHLGIFVVWLPAVLVSTQLTRNFKRKDFWNAALRGCPPWMKYMVYGFLGYAVLNFIVFLAKAPPKGGFGPLSPTVVHGTCEGPRRRAEMPSGTCRRSACEFLRAMWPASYSEFVLS